MIWDESKFPNNDPALAARGRLESGGEWHQFYRTDGGSRFRFTDGEGSISFIELTPEQMQVIADRATY